MALSTINQTKPTYYLLYLIDLLFVDKDHHVLVLAVFCVLVIVFSPFFFWPLYCLYDFYLQTLIIRLVSLNVVYKSACGRIQYINDFYLRATRTPLKTGRKRKHKH
jgi:hypothetical protein